MLNVEAIPMPDILAVRLRCDSDTMVRRIERETDTGWVPIRTIAGTLPQVTIVVEDYECPLNTPVRYKVQADNNPAKFITVKVDTSKICLSLPHMPKISVVLPTFSDYSESRKMPGSTDLIIGRTDPLVTILPLQKRQGALKFTFDDYSDAVTVQNLYAQGYPLLLRQPCNPGLDLYHTAESTSITPRFEQGVRLWELSVSYVEQNIPSGDLIGTLGWDYLALANRHPDYVDMESSYKDYGYLLMDMVLNG